MTHKNRSTLRLAVACLWLLNGGTAPAQGFAPDLDPRIREGVEQFDRGDLAAAKASFEAVLADDPDHVIANYELAYTHIRLGELERGLEIMDDAIERELPVTAEFYALSASVLDNLGRQEQAVRRFEQGAGAFPDNHNLRLNYGITQFRMNDRAGARASFEQAATLLPDHPSAHFFLGQIYAGEGLTAAAVLALGKSIGFDNQGQRIAASASAIKSLMENGIATSDDGMPIVVLPVDYQVPPMTIEKFSAAVPMRYGLALAAQRKTEGDLSYEPYAIAFATLVAEFVGAEIDPASHFAADHYLAFFEPLAENGHTMTFAHLILGSLNPEAASGWMQENGEQLAAFRAWLPTR